MTKQEIGCVLSLGKQKTDMPARRMARPGYDRPVALTAREDVRKYDHDRYLARLFAPAGKRDALIALLGFNLEVAKVRELTSEAAARAD
jgi:hypothetical protein